MCAQLHASNQPAVDTVMTVEGCRLVARDVLADGSLSVIKQQLGEYETPEHAEVMGLLLDDPRLFIYADSLTNEVFDRAAALLRERKRG